MEGCEVTGFDIRKGRVESVHTREDRVNTPIVVNAAGVWAPLLGRLVGIEIPTVMYRRHQWIIQADETPGPIPCTIDVDSTFFVRPEGARYLLGIGGEKPATTYDTTVDPDAFVPVAEIAVARFPSFQSARLVRTYAGLTQETPDRHPVLGPAGPSGHFVAAGFSHGFMHAPAAGTIMAECITSGRSETIPLEPFSLGRFAQAKPDRQAAVGRKWEAH